MAELLKQSRPSAEKPSSSHKGRDPLIKSEAMCGAKCGAGNWRAEERDHFSDAYGRTMETTRSATLRDSGGNEIGQLAIRQRLVTTLNPRYS